MSFRSASLCIIAYHQKRDWHIYAQFRFHNFQLIDQSTKVDRSQCSSQLTSEGRGSQATWSFISRYPQLLWTGATWENNKQRAKFIMDGLQNKNKQKNDVLFWNTGKVFYGLSVAMPHLFMSYFCLGIAPQIMHFFSCHCVLNSNWIELI